MIFTCEPQCIYAITKRVGLAVNEETPPEGKEILGVIIAKQLPYFCVDVEDVYGLIRYYIVFGGKTASAPTCWLQLQVLWRVLRPRLDVWKSEMLPHCSTVIALGSVFLHLNGG